MSLEDIKVERQRQIERADRRTDRKCEEELRRLVAAMPEPLRLTKVICGNGTYAVWTKVKYLSFVHRDTPYDLIEEESEPVQYNRIFDWVVIPFPDPDEYVLVGEGIQITADEVLVMAEKVRELLVWWVDTTGGSDVVFEGEE